MSKQGRVISSRRNGVNGKYAPQISLAHSGFPNRARRGAPKLELVRIKPSTPEPCTTLKSVTVISGRARDLSCVFSSAVPVLAAASSTALAIGCEEARSRFAAIARAFGEKRGAEILWRH